MDKPHPEHEKKQKVAVVTTSGRWPAGRDFEEAPRTQKVQVSLEKAARALHLTSTEGWIATVDGKEIKPALSFEENGLGDKVVIDFHQRAGGGGCTRR